MNLDRTFCQNKACDLKDKCDRSTVTLTRWIKAQTEDTYIRPVSMTTFKPDANGECDWYGPVEERTDE